MLQFRSSGFERKYNIMGHFEGFLRGLDLFDPSKNPSKCPFYV
jgi:hypothetical protein